MPPSKPACQVLSATYRLAGEISDKLGDILNTVARIFTLKAKIRFGWVDIVDAVGAEIVAAIGSVSSRVAKNVLGPISKMAANYLETVFSLILKILLAFPTSVFSLVAIPHDAAMKATKRERTYLNRADENLKRIIYIVIKWTRGKSGSEFKEKMIQALPFIIRAIELCEDLIYGLKGEPTKPEEFGDNSVFKKGIYQKIKSNLNTAINVSKPESIIAQRLEINKRLEDEKRKRYDEKADSIKQEYGERRKQISENYRKNLLAVKPNSSDTAPNRLEDAVKEHGITLVYKQELELLDAWKKDQLAAAELEAETESLFNKDVWTSAFTTLGERFILDMETLGEQLSEMLGNIKDAYIQNKLSQLHCNTVYDVRNIIVRLVNEMIAYMREAGNATAEVLSISIERAQSLIEVARDNYQSSTNPGFEFSASEYAKSLTIGHGTLVAADAILDSAVTDSLIDLINSDDVLAAENDQFNEFIADLAGIPDWDGEVGVWSVDITRGAVSPYIQLIADITEMLAKVPILSVRNKTSDRIKVESLIKGVRKDFRWLKRHNSLVINVLRSYVPYVGSEAGDLMKILASAGLLESFATTMSVASLATNIVSNFKDNFGDEFPNYDNCSESYPELFANPNTLKGSTDIAMNMPEPKLNNSYQEQLEKGSRDKEMMYLKDENEKINFEKQDGGDDRNLLGNEVSLS